MALGVPLPAQQAELQAQPLLLGLLWRSTPCSTVYQHPERLLDGAQGSLGPGSRRLSWPHCSTACLLGGGCLRSGWQSHEVKHSAGCTVLSAVGLAIGCFLTLIFVTAGLRWVLHILGLVILNRPAAADSCKAVSKHKPDTRAWRLQEAQFCSAFFLLRQTSGPGTPASAEHCLRLCTQVRNAYEAEHELMFQQTVLGSPAHC